MRMPGMDGAALLTAIRDRYPATVRIVLSGHAERDAVKRALGIAHQFLAKPCDADALKVVIERACGLQTLLAEERLRELVGRLDKLPSVPQVYVELLDAVDRTDCSVAMIARIIAQDPAMSVKVLQLVNSAYFGLSRRLTSIGDAVAFLGSDLLRSLALTAHIFARMSAAPIPGFSVERLQARAIYGAKLARAALGADKRRADAAFTAALVRDVGVLVLAIGLPAIYAEVLATAARTGEPVHEVERVLLGVSHAEVGAYLLGVWGLPVEIVEAVGYHHTPTLVGHLDRAIVDAVAAADLGAEADA